MIEQVIKLFPSKAAFCREIGMAPQFLTQIERGERRIPPRYALRIERIPGSCLTVHDLRPDIFGASQANGCAPKAAA